jgi:hypothetical protein
MRQSNYKVGDTVTTDTNTNLDDFPKKGVRYVVKRVYKSRLPCPSGYLTTVVDKKTGKKYAGYDLTWFKKVRSGKSARKT